ETDPALQGSHGRSSNRRAIADRVWKWNRELQAIDPLSVKQEDQVLKMFQRWIACIEKYREADRVRLTPGEKGSHRSFLRRAVVHNAWRAGSRRPSSSTRRNAWPRSIAARASRTASGKVMPTPLKTATAAALRQTVSIATSGASPERIARNCAAIA